MNLNNFYSIRMRASLRGKHVSGAEKLVPEAKIDPTVSELITRSMNREKAPDKVTITIDDISASQMVRLKALDLVTITVNDSAEGRSAASRVLCTAGISKRAADTAIALISRGASSSGENMRGAMIIDGQTGERLEPDRERGIRASRFDWNTEAGERIELALRSLNLGHFRTREALALATKIASGPGVIGELCWSDAPDYTAGYVASKKTGYVRFPFLKEKGDQRGGRAIFVDQACNVELLTSYLETTVTLIDEVGTCRSALNIKEYFVSFPFMSFPNASIGNPGF